MALFDDEAADGLDLPECVFDVTTSNLAITHVRSGHLTVCSRSFDAFEAGPDA